MATFSWLHFSDLHAGQEGLEERWAPIEDKLHEDLRRLHRKMAFAPRTGWDAVLFTGDLAFSASKSDYEKVDEKLESLWKLFDDLGCNPVLIAIPGNHDAAQNEELAAKTLITIEPTDDAFWSDASQKYVKAAFANFQAWYECWQSRHPLPGSLRFRRDGLVPGDLSAFFEKDGLRVGVLGLNSAFVHLASKPARPAKGNLILDPKQKHRVWSSAHYNDKVLHAAIILTHHPREWLRKDENGRGDFASNIAPQTEFLLHCFGHMHEGVVSSIRVGGAKAVRRLQGASLFGMEAEGRIHGYSGGNIECNAGGIPRLRIWPRFARRPDDGEYSLAPDWAHFDLDDEEAITEPLPDLPRPDQARPDEARAEERELATKLLCAALATDSEPEGAVSAVDVEPLLALLLGKIPQDAQAGALTRQARLVAEHYLLDPGAEGLESLHGKARDAALSETVEVSPKFFARVQDRNAAWKCYFEALKSDAKPSPAIETLCLVGGTAFIAPQHLLAGLLARMEYEWSKVLDVYDRVAEDATNALGRPPEEGASAAFDRLQTAQWICWLIWGPSIPACTCYMWDGLRVLQLGYGDENYSLPVFDAAGAHTNAGLLDRLSSGLRKTGVAAVPVAFSGRLTWAPALFDGDESKKVARTQRSLLDRDGGSVAVLLESAEETDKANRSYFTSYQWMMFLIGKDPKKAGGPPRLLRDAPYPAYPPKTDQARADVLGRRLWRNLVPVFVHANLADAEVFKRQRAMLVDNAVALLHSLWRERQALFDEADCRDGIRFFLVAASDHTGCGHEPRFPSEVPLAMLLKKRLQLETDADLRNAISVPDFNKDDKAWSPIAGYFSTCGMPLMISNYYDYVKLTGTDTDQ